MLYKKQETILKQIKPKSLIPLGTGTGKTLIALEYYFRNEYPTPLYILAPAAKVYECGWDREIEKIAQYHNVKVPNYKVISYTKILKNASYIKNSFFILDEAHYIKNSTSQRGKGSIVILKNFAKNFIMLTATPASKIEEYVSYFILWGMVKNKTDFYKRFIVMEPTKIYGKNFMEIASYKNLPIFWETVKQNTTQRLTVNDIVELPKLIIKDIYLEKSKEYNRIKKERIDYDFQGNSIYLDTQIKLCSYLRQNVSSKKKIELLRNIVEEIKESGENLLIFYNFNCEYIDIVNAIKPDYLINGILKNFPKKEEFENLKSKITLVQIQAGGTGIELQYNSQVLYYSPTYSYQDYEQSLGRAYRPGQKHKVLIRRFNTIDSIEQDVWNAISKKEDFNERMWK
ncbi:helicase-related protein [Streptobacillus moniliformis]|uniref:helicase-related protein n=1 Tax=Streptobacillus moniliformis TaxID=34105 RepID=UPI0007E377E4|nr:helicase-related protein [Streptobacillus moniliformis]